MKQLYINDQRLIIDESNAYFPFTYTINDLENINIINLPISKDIEVPRCATNDEIFGYIGDLTRITSNLDNNNSIGVSFNQTKKCIYKLMSDSEIVSEGLLIVKSVNNDSYTIQLLDELVNKLENLNDIYLNEIDLYDNNDQVINFESNASNVIGRTVLNKTDLIPTFNVNESDLDLSTLIISGGTKITLPSEFTPIQARTFKNYDINWAMPIYNVINSINKNNLGVNIVYDELLNEEFNDLHLIMNKQKNETKEKKFIITESPRFNLLRNSAYVSMAANNTGLGTSVLKTNEVNPYYTVTPYADKIVSLFGYNYTYTVGKKYIMSIYVRHSNSSAMTFVLYNQFNQSASTKSTIVQPNIWTQISTNAFTYAGTTTGNFILQSNVVGKSFDYKMGKIEEVDNLTDTASRWSHNFYDSGFQYETPYSVNTIHKYLNYYLNPNEIDITNGKYYFNLNVEIDIDANFDNNTPTFLTSYNNINYTLNNVNDGDFIGSVWLNSAIQRVKSSKYEGIQDIPNAKDYITPRIDTNVPLFYNKNIFFDIPNKKVKIITNIQLTYDYYAKIEEKYNYKHFLNLNFSTENISYDNKRTLFYFNDARIKYSHKILNSELNISNLNVRTGDMVNGATICPKIKIKDFLINLTKLFNLGIKIDENRNILLFKKNYKISNKQLILDESELEINPNLISFNKIKMYTNSIDNDLIKNYEEKNEKKWAEQIINVGYSIKEKINECNFNTSIPFLIKDVNGNAYNKFINYYNGSYNAFNHGNIEGTNDKLTLSFINKNIINKGETLNIYHKGITVSDDCLYEITHNTINGNIYTNQDEENFSHVNTNLSGSSWEDLKFYNDTNVLYTYYTTSPYIFDENLNIIKSLDINKPIINYAGINDSNYNDNVTLYSKYWKKEIRDKYSVNTHILKTKMYIDINTNIFNIYNYKNSNYIISKLTEYDPTTPDMYEVELLKVNDVNNYIIDQSEILTVNSIITNPTSKFNNNGLIQINFTSGSGNYELELYKDNILLKTGNTTNNYFIFDSLVGGFNYKVKIKDGNNTINRDFYMYKVGVLTTNYTYTVPTSYANNDATLTVNITDGVPGYSISILNSNTYEVIQSVTNINNFSHTFYNLRSGIPYLVIISDNSIDNDNININLTIENIKNFVYTTKQSLIFDGDVTGYGNYFNNITNDFYIKETTGLTFNKINSNLGGTHTLTYNSGTNKTTLYQENVNNNYLIENKNYNFKLVNNTFNYNASGIPVKYNLYDTGVMNFNATNTTSAGNLIMNNSLGYGNITLETGNQNFYGIYITPIINSIEKYSDGEYRMILYNYYQSYGGIKRIDNYTDFSQGNIAFEYNNGSGWYTAEITGGIIETGFYSNIYWQKIEVDFGDAYFSSLPIFNTNLRNVKFTKNTENIYNNIILTFIGSDFNNIYVRLNNGEVYYAYQSEENKNSYADLVGDNGTPPTSIKLLNYNCVIDYTIS